MRSIDNTFYQKPEWKRCRKAYLQYVSGRCERCLKKGLHVPASIVHHKTYLTEENYNDPATIYYNNPKELKHLIEQIENGHQLFKKNPGYTPTMGQKLNDMIARIKKHF